jgi:enoyl-CoA hydratase
VESSSTPTDRWKALDFGPPSEGGDEPDDPVLTDYLGDGAIAVITLNRPHADNAITTEMGARLTDVLETIAVRRAVRVTIITGSGNRAFSVGRPDSARHDEEDWLRQRQVFSHTLYAASCDADRRRQRHCLRRWVGTRRAPTSSSRPKPRRSASPGDDWPTAGGGSPFRVLPPGKAMQMLLTAIRSRPEAHRLGMVNEVHPQTELMMQLGDRREGRESPTAVQAVKRTMPGQGQPTEQAIAIMMEAHWRSAVHPDRIEGIGAFNDDRDPIFQDPDY